MLVRRYDACREMQLMDGGGDMIYGWTLDNIERRIIIGMFVLL